MKVLLTATVQSHICQFHRPLVAMLHDHGAEVHVAARNNLAEKNGLKLDFADKVFDVPFARSPKSPDNIRAYKQLKKIIDKGGYDVIHCNTPVGGVITRLAAKGARKRGAKVFYTAHGFHFYKGASRKNWLVFYPIERLMAGKTDKLITINTEDYALAKRKFPCKVCYTHGVGVDASRYSVPTPKESQVLRAELGLTATQPIILCVGELLPNKNQQMAIRAMVHMRKRHPDALLLLAGNGPEKDHLQALVNELHLGQNVMLLGYCTCLEKYQKCANVAVACSKREGLPLNVIEAQLSGVPVVATDNRGHRDLLEGSAVGSLVTVDDIEGMADAVLSQIACQETNGRPGKVLPASVSPYASSNVMHELEDVYSFKADPNAAEAVSR